MSTGATSRTGRSDAGQVLRELRQLQRELLERDLVRRADALDSAQETVEGVAEIGSSVGILDRAARALGETPGFSRVLVSQVDGDRMRPKSVWIPEPGDPELVARLMELEIRLEYPLVEAEVANRGGGAVVAVADSPRSPAILRAELGWESYVLAPLRLGGSTAGLIHAEPSEGSELGADLDREVATVYAKGLAAAFERAVLREAIQRHREELRSAVAWMSDHLDRGMAGPLPADPGHGNAAAPPGGEGLTRREREVMEMLGRGQTNAAIAASLLVSESTVKFHVKNILLKLGATSRADAVARYLRGAA